MPPGSVALCGFAAPAKIQQAILAHERVALELGSSRTRLRLDAAIGPALPRRATLMVRTLRDARLDTREAPAVLASVTAIGWSWPNPAAATGEPKMSFAPVSSGGASKLPSSCEN